MGTKDKLVERFKKKPKDDAKDKKSKDKKSKDKKSKDKKSKEKK